MTFGALRGEACQFGITTAIMARHHLLQGLFMPFITISATQSFSQEQKKALLHKASDAVIEAVGASLKSVRVMLHELPGGHYLAEGKLDTPAINFRVDMIEGRTEQQKAALIAGLSKSAHEATGISEDDVRVWLIDMPSTNVGMAGGKTARQAGR